MDERDWLLGVDLGAGGLKATLISAEDGATVAEAAHPIETLTPHQGWAEQRPADWADALWAAISATLAKAGAGAGARVAGVGLSAGAHIAVLTDIAGHPIRNAIMWSDQRSAGEAKDLRARADKEILARSLNRANPTWGLCHLAWLTDHEAATVRRASRLYAAKDWLRAQLTGDWTTDFSDALGLLMGDAETRGWSPEICDLIGWPLETLPPVAEPCAIAGQVTRAAAARTGLRAGTPVAVGSNDTTVELYGAGAVNPGEGAIKLATAGVLFLTTAGPEVHPPVSCYPHIMDGRWYMASGMNACATAHKWVRDRFFPGASFEAMDAAAARVAPGAGGLLFHPYLQGERAPHWDPKLKASFTGITLRAEGGEFARACYEGIAFALADMLRAAKDLSGAEFGPMRLLGGGARSETWRGVIADATGLTMLRPANGDASFGAALVAGVAADVFASRQAAVAQCARILDETPPDPARAARYAEIFEVWDETRARLTEPAHRLHDLFA